MVIENKVFSLPDTDQLTKYARRLAGHPTLSGARQILLSLPDPGWGNDVYDTADAVSNGRAWHRVSYASLATAIIETVPEDNSYDVQLILRYANLVSHLQRLADLVAVRHDSESVALPQTLGADLGDPRLFASLSKLRARSIAATIQQDLRPADPDADVTSGFSNGSPVITAFHCPLDSRPEDLLAGWQLQGSHFRRYVILSSLGGNSKKRVQARMDWASEHGEFFDFAPIDHVLDTGDAPLFPKMKAGKPRGFNQYNPDFVYRSKKVPDLTVDQLIRAARLVLIDVRTKSIEDARVDGAHGGTDARSRFVWESGDLETITVGPEKTTATAALHNEDVEMNGEDGPTNQE